MVGESPTIQRTAEQYIGAAGYPTTTPWQASDAPRRSMPRWLIMIKDEHGNMEQLFVFTINSVRQ